MNKVTLQRVADGAHKIGSTFCSIIKNDISDQDAEIGFGNGVGEIYNAGYDRGFNTAYKVVGVCIFAVGFFLDFYDKKRFNK